MDFNLSLKDNPLILYEDEYIIAVNKPAGMLAQADNTGRKSLHGIVTDYLKEHTSGSKDVFCSALHRLDMPVSGVMLFAKTSVAAGRLSDDIKFRNIKKFYCAIVSPVPAASSGEWTELNQYMVRRRDRGYIVNETDPGAVPVSLKYRMSEVKDLTSLVLIELITGKRHQIRVQLSSIGSPIIGDKFYGSKISAGDDIISLHAHYLCFTHPMTQQPMTICAPLPEHMTDMISVTPDITDYISN